MVRLVVDSVHSLSNTNIWLDFNSGLHSCCVACSQSSCSELTNSMSTLRPVICYKSFSTRLCSNWNEFSIMIVLIEWDHLSLFFDVFIEMNSGSSVSIQKRTSFSTFESVVMCGSGCGLWVCGSRYYCEEHGLTLMPMLWFTLYQILHIQIYRCIYRFIYKRMYYFWNVENIYSIPWVDCY